MSMVTPHEWNMSSTFNISMAQGAQTKATWQRDYSKRAHQTIVSENLQAYNEVCAAISEKIRNTQSMIRMLTQAKRRTEMSKASVEDSLNKLEAAHRAKDNPLWLCMWRLEQRERRPMREQVRDNVEVALEQERSTLVDSQMKLQAAIRKSKDQIAKLDSAIKEASQDITYKEQALTVDETCDRTARQSFNAMMQRASPQGVAPSAVPSSPTSSRHPADLTLSNKNEQGRLRDAEKLKKRLQHEDEEASRLVDTNNALILRCDEAARSSLEMSELRIQARIAENDDMCKSLERELRETTHNIKSTKGVISDTRYQLRSLEEPIEYATSCFGWRSQRVVAEHIADPVTARLREHRNVVLQAQSDLCNHHNSEKMSLRELMERKKHLKDDLKDKIASLTIDSECLRRSALVPRRRRDSGSKPGKDRCRGDVVTAARSQAKTDFAHLPTSGCFVSYPIIASWASQIRKLHPWRQKLCSEQHNLQIQALEFWQAFVSPC